MLTEIGDYLINLVLRHHLAGERLVHLIHREVSLFFSDLQEPVNATLDISSLFEIKRAVDITDIGLNADLKSGKLLQTVIEIGDSEIHLAS